jgi:DNA-binding transcriptional ArsR family regulator
MAEAITGSGNEPARRCLDPDDPETLDPADMDAPTDVVFRAVADPTRRAILGDLRHGARSVNAIASRFRISRPAVSKHLRVLREAKLVVDHRQGRQRICVLDPIPLRQVDQWVNEFRAAWKVRLGGLKAYLEAKPTAAARRTRARRK